MIITSLWEGGSVFHIPPFEIAITSKKNHLKEPPNPFSPKKMHRNVAFQYFVSKLNLKILFLAFLNPIRAGGGMDQPCFFQIAISP